MGWEESELLQQYGGVEDCEAYEILGQSSLSATKSPQYERVIKGLGLLFLGGISSCGKTMLARENFEGPRV